MDAKSMMIAGVTGGVGRKLLEIARSAGWSVVGVYHQSHEEAEALGREWAGAPGSLQMFGCDLTDPADVGRLLETLPDFCPYALVHLVSPPIQVSALHRVGWDEFQRQLDGVLKPVVLLTRPLLGRMMRHGSGRVIAALSAVVLGAPPRGFSSYTVAKYALAGYMRSIGVECAGRGVTANTVSPGPMNTRLLRHLPELLLDQIRAAVPGGSWIEPESVARAIFWLASEAGPEVNGCNLPLTSGMAV